MSLDIGNLQALTSRPVGIYTLCQFGERKREVSGNLTIEGASTRRLPQKEKRTGARGTPSYTCVVQAFYADQSRGTA